MGVAMLRPLHTGSRSRGVGGLGLFDDGVDGGFGFGSSLGGAVCRRVMTEIVGRVERVDALVAFDEQEPFEQAAALVVQKILVPPSFGEFGNDDDDAAIGVFGGELENVLNDGDDHEAIWRRDAN